MVQRTSEPPANVCLAPGGISLCLHGVQQSNWMITHKEWKWCFRWQCYTLW